MTSAFCTASQPGWARKSALHRDPERHRCGEQRGGRHDRLPSRYRDTPGHAPAPAIEFNLCELNRRRQPPATRREGHRTTSGPRRCSRARRHRCARRRPRRARPLVTDEHGRERVAALERRAQLLDQRRPSASAASVFRVRRRRSSTSSRKPSSGATMPPALLPCRSIAKISPDSRVASRRRARRGPSARRRPRSAPAHRRGGPRSRRRRRSGRPATGPESSCRPRSAHDERKPMWQVDVSIVSPWRAAGR